MAGIAKIEEFLQENWKFILILAVLLIIALSLIMIGFSMPSVRVDMGHGNSVTGNVTVNIGDTLIEYLVIIGKDIQKLLGAIFK